MPALIGYYTMHELDNNRIGFAPHKDSPKPKLQKATDDDLPVEGNYLDGTYNNVEKKVEKIEVIDYSAERDEANRFSWVTVSIIFLILFVIGYYGIFTGMNNKSCNSFLTWSIFALWLGACGVLCFWYLQVLFYEILMGEKGLKNENAEEDLPDNTSPVDGTIETLFTSFANQLLFF